MTMTQKEIKTKLNIMKLKPKIEILKVVLYITQQISVLYQHMVARKELKHSCKNKEPEGTKKNLTIVLETNK